MTRTWYNGAATLLAARKPTLRWSVEQHAGPESPRWKARRGRACRADQDAVFVCEVSRLTSDGEQEARESGTVWQAEV